MGRHKLISADISRHRLALADIGRRQPTSAKICQCCRQFLGNVSTQLTFSLETISLGHLMSQWGRFSEMSSFLYGENNGNVFPRIHPGHSVGTISGTCPIILNIGAFLHALSFYAFRWVCMDFDGHVWEQIAFHWLFGFSIASIEIHRLIWNPIGFHGNRHRFL